MDYTLLTTCPPYGSQNVGDLLIERQARDLIEREKGPCRFLTVFREEPLDAILDRVNRCRAVLLPGFAIRDLPMHPGGYRLVEDVSRIRVPMIPIGSNWNVYPGDAVSRRQVRYSEDTLSFLRRVAGGVPDVSCREYFVCDVLQRHGISNTRMTGDPACFLLPFLGNPMRRPGDVRRLVFSPPLSAFYLDQARQVMTTLAARFPDAERICAFHLHDADTAPKGDSRRENSAALSPQVTQKNRAIRTHAAAAGYRVMQMAGSLEHLDLYDRCDLHVGYECHAHLNFFGRRIPSVLIAEDARGVGFNDLFGAGGFSGFRRVRHGGQVGIKQVTSSYCTTAEEADIAPPREDLHQDLDEFLAHECESRFRRYIGVAHVLDDLYETRMRPFLRTLP